MSSRISKELAPFIVPIGSVKPHPKNPNQGDIGAISESLEEHGQYKPIIVSKKTRRIVAGNHTHAAAVALGWSEIAAVFDSYTPQQELRILAVDNRTRDLAATNDQALADLLTELASTPSGLTGTGFDGDDLDALLADLSRPLSLPDPKPDRMLQHEVLVTIGTDRVTFESIEQLVADIDSTAGVSVTVSM